MDCENCVYFENGFCEYWEQETDSNDWCEFCELDIEEEEILSFYQ